MNQSHKLNIKEHYSKILFWTGETLIVLGVMYMVKIFHVLWALTLPKVPYQETIFKFKSWSTTPGLVILIAGIFICGLATGKISDIVTAVKGKK